MKRALLWIPLTAAACTAADPATRAESTGGVDAESSSSAGAGEETDGSTGDGTSGDDGTGDETGGEEVPVVPECDGTPDKGSAERLLTTAWTPTCYTPQPGETADMLVDGTAETKFLVGGTSIQVRFNVGVPHVLTRYAITSANDHPERDPVRWILNGSNDGKTWTPIDTRTAEDFPNRLQRREFAVDTCRAYRYYLLRAENEDGGYSQMSEVEFYGVSPYGGEESRAPAAVTGLSATPVSRRQINLQWVDNSDNERFFRVEASSYGQPFRAIGYARAEETQFLVRGLDPGSPHSFRIVAENSTGDAAFSNLVEASTLPRPVGIPQGDGWTRYTEDGYSLTTRDLDGTMPQAFLNGLIEEFFLGYPQIVEEYHPQAPKDVRAVFDPDQELVSIVDTATATFSISSTWAKGKKLDSIHVIFSPSFGVASQYPEFDTPSVPFWIATGLRQLARFDHTPPTPPSCWTLERYQPSHAYTEGWSIAGRFLVWLRDTYGEQLIYDADDALHSGQYGDDTFWPSRTGKSLDELWADYAAASHEPLAYE